MTQHDKLVDELTSGDLRQFPVWEYTNANEACGEETLRPVEQLPVEHLRGHVVGSEVRLANGSLVWALLGNIDSDNPRMTEHFITLTLFKNDERFTMARYHDFASDERGPRAAAGFLGLSVDDVFPITYDVRRWSVGSPAALVGTIEKEPRERLTREQIIALAVP